MRKHWIDLVMIELVFLLLGIFGGKALTVLHDTTLIWRSLGSPPGQTIRIVDGDYLTVHVQTVQGHIYFCRLHTPKECWIQDDRSSHIPYATTDSPGLLKSFRQPPPLSGVVGMKKFYTSFDYKQILAVYAITDKGEVYFWQDGRADIFDPIIYGCQGILVALLSGFAVWWFLEWRMSVFERSKYLVALKPQ